MCIMRFTSTAYDGGHGSSAACLLTFYTGDAQQQVTGRGHNRMLHTLLIRVD